MSLRISYAPYRLLFKHPFAIAHGVRDGTDSIFIRLNEDGIQGYGEVTLPPYLKEKPDGVVDRLKKVVALGLMDSAALSAALDDPNLFNDTSTGCRAALQTALIDLQGKKLQLPAEQLLEIDDLKSPINLFTIGMSALEELPGKLRELPQGGALKVKVGDIGSKEMLHKVMELDDRQLFLDANQGLASVEAAEELVRIATGRLLAMEQPFPVDSNAMQQQFQAKAGTAVYGDESIQDLAGLERAVGVFKGVNIKLMKCGGLDRAKTLAERAGQLGMQVMLGSMSESSLGSTAMALMAGLADITDLDGPWLIKNDPFRGITWRNGRLVMPDAPGIGAEPVAELPFIAPG